MHSRLSDGLAGDWAIVRLWTTHNTELLLEEPVHALHGALAYVDFEHGAVSSQFTFFPSTRGKGGKGGKATTSYEELNNAAAFKVKVADYKVKVAAASPSRGAGP